LGLLKFAKLQSLVLFACSGFKQAPLLLVRFKAVQDLLVLLKAAQEIQLFGQVFVAQQFISYFAAQRSMEYFAAQYSAAYSPSLLKQALPQPVSQSYNAS
jgi:hypothetical protein